MNNREKLKRLLMDIFLMDEADFRFDLRREEIPTWDSLATVSMAVGVQESFGHHFTPSVALGVQGFADIVRFLESKGVALNE